MKFKLLDLLFLINEKGSNRDGRIQPEYLVHEQNIIVIQINYRLGFIGSWYNQDTGDTNFGILDQRLAMEWVQDSFILSELNAGQGRSIFK